MCFGTADIIELLMDLPESEKARDAVDLTEAFGSVPFSAPLKLAFDVAEVGVPSELGASSLSGTGGTDWLDSDTVDDECNPPPEPSGSDTAEAGA